MEYSVMLVDIVVFAGYAAMHVFEVAVDFVDVGVVALLVILFVGYFG
jgi:hypothetical protein